MMVFGQVPEGLSLTNEAVAPAKQLSEQLTRLTFGAGTSSSHDTVTGPGHVASGGVLSSTVMICVQSSVFPQASVHR
jgi:hypothetical protein